MSSAWSAGWLLGCCSAFCFGGRVAAAWASCAVIIWLSLLGFAQVYSLSVQAGYLLAGLMPAASMRDTPLIWPNPAIPAGPAVRLLMLTSIAFSFSGARQTMAVRRNYMTRPLCGSLRDSEASYRLLADNVTDVISLASADNQRLYVSPSIEQGHRVRTANWRYAQLHLPASRGHRDGAGLWSGRQRWSGCKRSTTSSPRMVRRSGQRRLSRGSMTAAAGCWASRGTSPTGRRWKAS